MWSCDLKLYVLQIKCSQYWPISSKTMYGDIAVTLENTHTFPDYAIRTLNVQSVRGYHLYKHSYGVNVQLVRGRRHYCALALSCCEHSVVVIVYL